MRDAPADGLNSPCGTTPPVDDGGAGPLDGHATLAATHSVKFAALADLFRPKPASALSSVKVLAESCTGIRACRIMEEHAHVALPAALDWLVEHPDDAELRVEYARLFGGVDAQGGMRCVPPYAEAYLADGAGEIDRRVARLCAAHGFDMSGLEVRPSHIVAELGFVSHLLERSTTGDGSSYRLAREFLGSQLLSWAVVFAAATYNLPRFRGRAARPSAGARIVRTGSQKKKERTCASPCSVVAPAATPQRSKRPASVRMSP